MRALRLIVLGVAVAYVAVLAAAHFLYPRLLYPAPQTDRFAPAEGQLLSITGRTGAAVHAAEFAGPEGAQVVVYFHGNGVVIGDEIWMARELVRRGLGVVLCEYRGYGLSAGLPPTEEGLYEDAETILSALAARGIGSSRVVLFGQSLGTGIAAEMAAQGRGASLVLATPYTSIVDVMQGVVRMLPMRLLVRERFDTLAKAHLITVPTLILHGTDDEVVPHAMGQKLASSLPQARLISVIGGHHNDLFLGRGANLFDEVANFARSPPGTGSSR